ncbi:MAG: sulfite exporter TauE/SafE family protein [Bryobacteraceae bacterium]|jgi:uncharacterized membrane protein YfcA
MEYLLGFAVAVLIGLTGVGGGSVTAPALALFLGVGPAESVGTALIFTAIVKLVAAPIYIARKQVDFRILRRLLAGGLPGVLAGSYLLARLSSAQHRGPLYAVLGAVIILMALANLYRLFAARPSPSTRDRTRWLPWVAIPIGAEVGFSSAGAGAVGSLVLMTLTRMSTAQVVGTDVLFGLGLSLGGGGISLGMGNYHGALALKLAAGGVIGAFVGAHLLSILPPRPLRVALSLWLMSMGGQLCWRAVAG